MDAILLVSHGSVLCGHGGALMDHARRLRERGEAPIVEAGFLNYTEPSAADAAAECVRLGATRIAVTPFFLVPGKFVTVDLPAAIAAFREAHPDVEVSIAEAIGYDVLLVDAVVESALSAAPAGQDPQNPRRTANGCRLDPACPLFGTPDCPRAEVFA